MRRASCLAKEAGDILVPWSSLETAQQASLTVSIVVPGHDPRVAKTCLHQSHECPQGLSSAVTAVSVSEEDGLP